MASLIEKSATSDLLPLTVGTLALIAVDLRAVTSVAPFKGRRTDTDAALRKLGLGFPAPNTALQSGDDAILWTGRDQAFLIGADPAPLQGLAALTDQTDGWAALQLAGAGWRDALARLVAIDLRPAAFGPGAVARTGLNHMQSVLWCGDGAGVTILVFRSMAATAVHELETAMQAVAARAKA